MKQLLLIIGATCILAGCVIDTGNKQEVVNPSQNDGGDFTTTTLLEDNNYIVDKQATAKARWKIGEVLVKGKEVFYEDDGTESEYSITRRFMGVSTTGCYLLQDFYAPSNRNEKEVKYSNLLCFVRAEDVTTEYLILRGDFKGDRDNRVVTLFYKNGEKMESVTYDKTGDKHGPDLEWYKNGQKKKETFYQHDERVGKYQYWYQNGQLRALGQVDGDKSIGIWKLWNKEGKLKGSTNCDKEKCKEMY